MGSAADRRRPRRPTTATTATTAATSDEEKLVSMHGEWKFSAVASSRGHCANSAIIANLAARRRALALALELVIDHGYARKVPFWLTDSQFGDYRGVFKVGFGKLPNADDRDDGRDDRQPTTDDQPTKGSKKRGSFEGACSGANCQTAYRGVDIVQARGSLQHFSSRILRRKRPWTDECQKPFGESPLKREHAVSYVRLCYDCHSSLVCGSMRA